MTDTTPELLALLKEYIDTYPAFRSMPIGAPGSQARRRQEHEIALEERARAIIAKCASVDEQDFGWISIADRLPTHIYSVLGWIVAPGDIVVGKPFANPVIWNARRGKWQCGGYDFDDIDVEVTHWQPLPLGPKPRSKP